MPNPGEAREKKKEKARWDYTEIDISFSKKRGFYEEKPGPLGKEAFFKGRRIIGRDTPINKGVYHSPGSEALVVDDEKDVALHQLYKMLLAMREKDVNKGRSFKDGLLPDVWKLVMRMAPYNLEGSEMLRDRYRDEKILLGQHLNKAVCRHQALLVGYLLERLVQEGRIRGRVSVDRNLVRNKGGHAWARYTNSEGRVIIIDPAQQYIGYLEDMRADQNRWFYERPEDANGPKSFMNKLKGLLRLEFLGT